MNYFELQKIRVGTELLPWKDRSKSFSEGVFIISKYLSSDFPNLHVDRLPTKNPEHDYLVILYGDIFEILENGINDHDAQRLFELGWYIDDGIGEDDKYFKFLL